MQQRRLGRTGHFSSVVILGTAAFYAIDQEGAHAALDLAQAHGVNHLDVAPEYGNAQAVTGPWLESRREQFFLACKTLERARDAAWDDLHHSLRLLRTRALDLYQLHAVCTFEELDAAFAPGGAMETLVRAREAGLTRWLGITGHGLQAPAIQLAALDRFDFDTVMFPLNPRLYADLDYRRDAERLLETAQARDVGVMVIKAITKGPWGSRARTYSPWYEPYDTPDAIRAGVRFALSQPGVTAAASAADVRLLPAIFAAVEPFAPLSRVAQERLIAARAGDEMLFTPTASPG